jgi:hypothetical protein
MQSFLRCQRKSSLPLLLTSAPDGAKAAFDQHSRTRAFVATWLGAAGPQLS